jgi:hypothetical protein
MMPVMILVRLIILVKGDYATLFKIRSSRIEFSRGGYKLESVMNGLFITPLKWWPGPPFVACRGKGIVVYSLIVMGL